MWKGREGGSGWGWGWSLFGGVPPFVPTDIAGCVLWLDASAITGLVDGDPVGTWSDLSGSANDFTQTTTASKPTYKTNIQNSLPIVRFDGGDWLAETGSSASLQVTTLSLFIVFSATASHVGQVGGLGRYVGECAESFGNTVMHYTAAGAYLDIIYGEWRDSSNNNYQLNSTNPYSQDSWCIFGSTLTTGTSGWKFYKDGSANGSMAGFVLDTGTTGMQIGRGSNATYFLIGDVAEYLLYNTALSDVNRGLVEDYLGAKWGITVA